MIKNGLFCYVDCPFYRFIAYLTRKFGAYLAKLTRLKIQLHKIVDPADDAYYETDFSLFMLYDLSFRMSEPI